MDYEDKLKILFPPHIAEAIAEGWSLQYGDEERCSECGGETTTTSDNSDEYEVYLVNTCNSCGYTE